MHRLFLKFFIYFLVTFIIHLALLPGVILAESVQKDTGLVHLVLPGESLHKIARQYLPLTEELTINDLVEKINQAKKDDVYSFKTIHKRKDGSAILVQENIQYLKNKKAFKCIVREDYSLKKSS